MRNFAQTLFRSVVPAILLVLLTGGVILDVLINERLEEDFDDLLIAKALGLLALAEDGDDGVEMENYEVTLPMYALKEGAEFFQLIKDNDEVVINSDSLEYWQDSSHPFPKLAERAAQEFLNITLPDGTPGRMLRKRFVPRLDFDEGGASGISLELDARFLAFPAQSPSDTTEKVQHTDENGSRQITVQRQPLTLQLGVSRDALDSLIYQVHSVLILTGLSIMVLIVLLAKRGIHSAVKPLRRLTSELHEIDEQHLGQRLTTQTTVSEFSDLTHGVNVLLERVESAMDQERRFSGDVAHELRTPLTELRTLLEVSERWPEDPTVRASFNNDAREVAERMQRLVETLLHLSRSEHSKPLLVVCVSVNELLVKGLLQVQLAAKTKSITMNVNVPDLPVSCSGMDQWQSIIDNLLQNAIDYAPEGTSVDVVLTIQDNERFGFSVSNDAHDLVEADMDQLFERLWRKDSSRTSGSHSGLGLALVRACCNQVDAQIETSLHDGRLTMLVTAPELQSYDSDDGLAESDYTALRRSYLQT